MKTITTFLFCFLTFSLLAQEYAVSGTVISTAFEPLAGAHISLQNTDSLVLKNTITEDNGRFKLRDIPEGNYLLVVQFLGFEDNIQKVNVSKRDALLGAVQMQDTALNIDGVEVKETAIIATQNGDTTSYNAGAFRTLKDANADELVEKMPGVVIQNGKIQAQGEDVKEVLVDGRPFFGNDPMAALRNLPAEVVDKIQVFDQKSDQSNFSGFDDGNTTKTLNIVTKSNMRAGQFGKAYAAYGYENKYNTGGNISFLNGDQRLSIIGQSNNINLQNFSSEDLLGVTSGGGGRRGRGRGRGRGGSQGASSSDFLIEQQGGIAQTHALGLNFADRWGKKVDVAASYFFNNSNNESIELLDRTFVDTENSTELYQEENTSEANNSNHRLNMRLEYKIDSLNSLIMRPRLSLQQNDGDALTFGETTQNGAFLNRTDNDFFSDLVGSNFSNNLLWRHKFRKHRRTFSMNVSMGYNSNNGDSDFQSLDEFSLIDPLTSLPTFRLDTINQMANLESNGWNIGSNVSFTEPLNEEQQLMFSYRADWKEANADQSTYDFSNQSNSYAILNSDLSNLFENTYRTQSITTGWNYRKNSLMLMARLGAQQSQLQSEQLAPNSFSLTRNYYNLLPMVMLRYGKSRQSNIRIMYRSNTNSPSVSQLQNVVDNSNPLQLQVGNPKLDQSVQHRFFARIQETNTEKSRVFFFMIGGTMTQNYIANSTYLQGSTAPIFEEYNIERGAQITQPINVNGQYTAQSFLTYGMPLKGLKTNLNINLSGKYTHTPSYINDQENFSNNSSLGVGIVLSSNISDKIDFTISSQSNFSDVKNTLQENLDTRYLNQATKLRFGWVFGKGFVYRTNLTHQYYDGLFDDSQQAFVLWNMALGKKILKNDLGEINISVYDILNQNDSYTRTVTETYFEDIRTNILQRYFMLNFIYNFRNFNSGKISTREAEREKRRRERGW